MYTPVEMAIFSGDTSLIRRIVLDMEQITTDYFFFKGFVTFESSQNEAFLKILSAPKTPMFKSFIFSVQELTAKIECMPDLYLFLSCCLNNLKKSFRTLKKMLNSRKVCDYLKNKFKVLEHHSHHVFQK